MNFLIIKDSMGNKRAWKYMNSFPYADVEVLLDHVRNHDPDSYVMTYVTQARGDYCACAYFGDNTDPHTYIAERLGVVEGLAKDIWPIFEAYARML